MTKLSFYATYLALFLGLSPWAHGQQAGSPPGAAKPRALAISGKPWSGDFDQMVERRQIRVLVPFSRTLYFNDKGHERGMTADLVRDFERYINQKYKTGNRPITVYLIPTTRDKLLSGVTGGLGDIAAGNLTVTEERVKAVDFVAPKDLRDVSELVITGSKSPAIAVVEDLAGKTVHVRKASSYYESLVALNGRFKQAGKPEVKLTLVPDALEDEDMLEMLNAGLLEVIVVDDWKAKMWAQVLPKVKVNEAVAVHSGGKIGWAIRKGGPKLEAAINDFYTNFVKKQGLVDIPLQAVLQAREADQGPDRHGGVLSASSRHSRCFRSMGEKYGFDALMLAAQGFQESQLNQNAKSHVGAIGVMQVMPATGAELKVGDVRAIEPNIHAGAKYMDQLMTRYFTDAKFDEQNRTLFAFAAYNCRPGNMTKMRKEAAKRSLDQDQWFNNVELVTAEKIGVETTTYVRNIYKYYVSYKLLVDAGERQQKAREQLAPGKS